VGRGWGTIVKLCSEEYWGRDDEDRIGLMSIIVSTGVGPGDRNTTWVLEAVRGVEDSRWKYSTVVLVDGMYSLLVKAGRVRFSALDGW